MQSLQSRSQSERLSYTSSHLNRLKSIMVMGVRRSVLMLLFLIGCITPATISAQTYNIKDLGALIGADSYAHGINNENQVVGYWLGTNGARAFLYNAGAITDLGSLGGTNNYALSINAIGQIVGFADDTNGVSAFLYSNGTITNLGTLGGLNSYAYGISDSGHVVGHLDTTNGARAFLYIENSVTNLGTLGGTNSFAFGINISNLVVGSSLTEVDATHAFLWQNGILTNLNQLIDPQSGWILNDARGINSIGTIVGWGITNEQEQAFLYSGGAINGIGVLPGGTNSFAYGINNANCVVGASMITNGVLQAFVWANGNMTNLNELLPPDSTWDLREARGINDSGAIVGWGVINGQEHAFILSSNAPPSVTLTNPVDNVLLLGPMTLSLEASATDEDGTIAMVEFYEGTTKLGEDAEEPYQLAIENVGEGVFELIAVAIDDAGARSTSAVVTVTVALPPSIAIQPQSQRVMTGSNATFTVTAAGTIPLSYQWRFNGGNISDATHSSYSITNVQTIHTGNYSVQITNLVGSVTSADAGLTVAVDPFNMGKGDWIYFLSMATNQLGGNVPSVTDIASLMNYERLQGMQFVVVKAGDGGTIWNQFNAELVDAAHAAGLKIFGYGRVFGTNIAGEIAVATNVLALGADGFVIDAEIEYESHILANNNAAAEEYCQGIRAAYPDAFLAHSPFALISYHSTFPYVTFGKHCDVVMPQCYWKSFGISPSNMVHQLDTQWSNWQNSLTGSNTAAIKPIA
ncbi:MAG: immunoglobulin domain-containing protein, partial [Verrucomicrobia bacterium]|nr:immunoglobulin domain-containing protein [Verrucomicrobiota bacterium]